MHGSAGCKTHLQSSAKLRLAVLTWTCCGFACNLGTSQSQSKKDFSHRLPLHQEDLRRVIAFMSSTDLGDEHAWLLYQCLVVDTQLLTMNCCCGMLLLVMLFLPWCLVVALAFDPVAAVSAML